MYIINALLASISILDASFISEVNIRIITIRGSSAINVRKIPPQDAIDVQCREAGNLRVRQMDPLMQVQTAHTTSYIHLLTAR